MAKIVKNGATMEIGSGNEAMSIGAILRRRKQMSEIQEQAHEDSGHSGAKYGFFDLVCIGVGSTVGSGCFVLTGAVLPIAGPSAVLSWAMAGAACCLSAVAYIDLSARLPASGSCYVFSFHSLGELAGILAALCLTLEYGVSAAGCARSWSALFAQLVGAESYMQLWYPGADSGDLYVDLGAGAVMLLAVALCSAGVDFGKIVINGFTMAKVMLLCFFLVAGVAATNRNVFESPEVFFPQGFGGTVQGASALFWGFVGFDEVCCLAGKAQDPAKTMPRALLTTLGITCLVSLLSQFALTGMTSSNDATSWPEAFETRGWIWAKIIASVGEAILLPLIVLLAFLPQPELFGAMAHDGVIPASFGRQDRKGTFVWGSNVTGLFCVLMATFVPFSVIWNLVSLGVLVSFNLTSSSLIMMRYGNGGEVTQPLVGKLVLLLWPFSAMGAYCFWLGFAQPMLEGAPWCRAELGCAVVGICGALACLVEIWRCGRQVEDNCDGFRTPLMPFLPGAAIFVNFILMSTMSWWDHVVLFIFLACGLSGYTVCRAVSEMRLRGLSSQV